MDSVFKSNIISGGVSGGGASTLNDVDPFNDGSGIALYKLDGDATDAGGTYNSTATNVTYSTGKFDQCAVFNGSNAKVVIPDIINSHFVSVSLWGKSDGTDSGAFAFFFPQKEIYGGIGSAPSCFLWGGGEYTGYDASLYADNQWHHYVLTADNATHTVKGYIDGVLVHTKVGTTDFPQDYNYSDNHIGYFYHPSTPAYHKVDVDQVRIFNRALTAVEVDTLYNES